MSKNKNINDEVFIKSKTSKKLKKLNFKKYINLLCHIHLSNGDEIEFCYDTDSIFFLIASITIKNHYSKIVLYKINNDKKIRCKEINDRQKSNL